MTNAEAIRILCNEWKCIDRNDGVNCDRKCESCDLVMDSAVLKDAYNLAIKALEAQEWVPSAQPEPCDDVVSREAAIDVAENAFVRGLLASPDIRRLPSAQPEIIRCKDCKWCEVWLTGGGEATSYGYCRRTNLRVLPYDFCSKAERRTNAAD